MSVVPVGADVLVAVSSSPPALSSGPWGRSRQLAFEIRPVGGPEHAQFLIEREGVRHRGVGPFRHLWVISPTSDTD